MEKTLLQQLKAASTQEEKAAIMLSRSLAALPEPLQIAVKTAAIPHWFNFQSLTHLLPSLDDLLYYALLELDFVEQVIGRGHAIKDKARQQILSKFWQEDEQQFRLLSGQAADFSASQESDVDASLWQAEEIYHRLVSDKEAGLESLKNLATQWANYQYSVYEEIAYAIQLAGEQVASGRLTGESANWTRLWQAKLALIYGRPHQAKSPLDQIIPNELNSEFLIAEYHQTRGDWLATNGDKMGMEAAWRQAYELYRQTENGRLDAYLVSEKLRQEGLPLPEEETVQDTTSPTPPGKDGLRLIDNVKAAWIEGVLEKALDEKFELRMGRDRSQPANIVYHRPQSLDRPLAGGHHLSRLFDAAGRSLLILGAPGSGKTITLLQLLDELLEEARQDGRVPIPLLFNLSSYTAFVREKKDKEHELGDWLAEQAYNQYRLNRKTTRQELDKGRITLLLDGLDEVSAEDNLRERCVTVINEFIQKTPCGLVVCSRITDYQTLQNRLELAQALVLQPLSNRQIDTFIRQIESPNEAALLESIQNNWQLREALRSPLLLNIFPQTFPAITVSTNQRTSLGVTVEDQRQALFTAYVDNVFEQPLPTKDETKIDSQRREKSMHRLSFLANRMQQVGTSLFSIEELQPSWLPKILISYYRGYYGYIHGLLIGIIVGLISFPLGRIIAGWSGGMISFLFFVLIGQVGGALAVRLTTQVNEYWLRAGIGGLIGGHLAVFMGGIFLALFFTVSNYQENYTFSDLINAGLIPWLFVGLGLFICNYIASLAKKIQLREKVIPIHPSFKRFRYYLASGSFFGCIYGSIVGIIFGVSGILLSGIFVGPFGNILSGLFSGLIVGLIGLTIGGAIGGLLAFLDTPRIDDRPIPGNGVWISLRNAIFMIVLITLIIGIPDAAIDLPEETEATLSSRFFIGIPKAILDLSINTDYFNVFYFLVSILPPTFTWFGGLAWCQHWALRFVLWRNGDLPFHLIPWLSEMTERGLLRRVGGGYIFIHRSLLEYFADLYEGPEGSVEV